MKQHAVWKDETGRARKGLSANFVDPFTYQEEKVFRNEMVRAEVAESKLLQQMNRERRREGAIPLSKVPSSMSPVGKLEARRQEARERAIVYNIDISHDTRLPYTLWLEIANQGRYGIISRAYDYWFQKLFNRVKSIANLVQYNFVFEPGKTQREKFELYAAEQTRGDNDLPYQPWSEDIKAERNRRSAYYRRTKREREGGVRKKWSKGPVRPFSNRRR